MKRSPIFVAFILLMPVLIFCQAGDNAAIRKMLTDMSPALKARDAATLKKSWADDSTFVATASLAYNKTEKENIIKNAPAIQSIGNPVAVSGLETVPPRQDTSAKAQQTIKAIEQEMLDALLKGDASANEKYMADTYIFTSPDGNVQDKTAAIRDLKSGDLKIESSKMEDLKVMVYGNTAVAAYKSTDKGKYKNIDLSGQYRWTDVFINQNGKWQLVAGHGTPIMPVSK